MSFEVIITDPEENSNQIIVNQVTEEIAIEIKDQDSPDKIEIIIDEDASQRAVDAANAAQAILDHIEDLIAGRNHYRGEFVSEAALNLAIPVGVAGDYATISRDGFPDQNAVWDDGDQLWRVQNFAGGSSELISIGIITRVGNQFTVPAGARWMINGNAYTNTLPFIFTVANESTGFKRIDALIATTLGFQLAIGVHYTDIITSPEIPENAIEVKEYRIDGNDIDDTVPVLLGQYVKRSWSGDIIINTAGNNVSLPNQEKSNFIIKKIGNNTIKGMSTFFLETVDGSWLSVGQLISIEIDSGFATTLKNGVTENFTIPMKLPGGVDMVVGDKTITYFRYTGTSLAFVAYSHVAVEVKAYADSQDVVKLNAAKAYADSQDVITLNTAKSYSDTQDTATLNAAKSYAEGLVTGLVDLRGNYNPALNSNLYPTSGGSGNSGAVKKGDVWIISGLGVGAFAIIGTKLVSDGDEIMSLIDAPVNSDSNWNITEHNFTYVPENTTNKSNGPLGDSAVLFPTEHSVRAYFESISKKRSFCLYGPDFSAVGSPNGYFMAKFGQAYTFLTTMSTSDHLALVGVNAYNTQLVTPYKCKISNIQMDLNSGSFITNTEISIWGRAETAVPSVNAVEYLFASKPGTQRLSFADVLSNVVIPANTALRIYVKSGSSATSASIGFLNIFFEEEY